MKSVVEKSNQKVMPKPKTAGAKTKAPVKELSDLFEDSLKDIYWAEKALTKAIPKMIKNATSGELTTALQSHLEVTKEHVTRLESVFSAIGVKAQAKKCDAMAGLMEEAEGIMEETQKGPVRDAGIISAAQKVEHYEIATYGTLCTFAKTLGQTEALNIMLKTLDEEKQADEILTEIAKSSVNTEAMNTTNSNGNGRNTR